MRIVSGMMLAASLVWAAGCGGSSEPTGESKPLNNPSPGGTAAPVDPGNTGGTTAQLDPGKKGTPPAPTAAVAWEMDPAKHVVPSAPVSGKLANGDFKPEAQFQGDTLAFRMLKDGTVEREITLRFSPGQAKTATEGLKFTVSQEKTAGPNVPVVTASFPAKKAGESNVIQYEGGYALTLELGKRNGDALPGKIFLSLPGDSKDVMAGTFTAEWIRPFSEPPGAEDVPFVQGKVTVTGATAKSQVRVGYGAEPKAGEVVNDSLEMQFVGAGMWMRSGHAKPRASVLVAAEDAAKSGRYEHTRLPPGRYLLYAGVTDGPLVWKWVNVPADGKLTVDFALDAPKAGKLEVAVPAGTTGKVQLAPADETPVPANLFFTLASFLDLEADVKDNGAKFDKLGVGRYEVKCGELSGVVEIKVNETAKLELKKK